MSRPTAPNITAGNMGWDGNFNQVKDVVLGGPFPLHVHTGDETDLESTFPAAAHDECVVWVNHTRLGLTLYVASGGSWMPHVQKKDHVSIGAAATQTANDIDKQVFFTGSTAFTWTLLPAAQWEGQHQAIKRLGTATITVDADGSETIDGLANVQLTLVNQAFRLYSDGTNIHIVF